MDAGAVDFICVLAAADSATVADAYVLGGVNVLQVNIPKIRRRETDWPYKVVLLTGALVMGLVGIKWHTFGGDPPTDIEVASWAEAMPSCAAPCPWWAARAAISLSW